MNLGRKSPASSMQKTYDECYLVCSTAIYFEGQNNEAEALRAWRNALDQIYYHNAYKIPSGYAPRTETERALQDSLRGMELQCKERVDLLEAMKKSREDALDEAEAAAAGDGPSKTRDSLSSSLKPSPKVEQKSWFGGDSVPTASYEDLPRPAPPLPARPATRPRPSYTRERSLANETPRTRSMQASSAPNLVPPPGEQPRRGSRTPSPEKKGGMLRTLRSNPKERSSSGKMAQTLRNKPPSAAAKAATQSWASGQRPSIGSAEQANPFGNARSPAATATSWDPYTRTLVERSLGPTDNAPDRRTSDTSVVRPPSPSDFMKPRHSNSSLEETHKSKSHPPPYSEHPSLNNSSRESFSRSDESMETARPPPPPPAHGTPRTPPPLSHIPASPSVEKRPALPQTLAQAGQARGMSYMKEYPNHPPTNPTRIPPEVAIRQAATMAAGSSSRQSSSTEPPKTVQAGSSPRIPRKSVGRAAGLVSAIAERQKLDNMQSTLSERTRADTKVGGQSDNNSSGAEAMPPKRLAKTKAKAPVTRNITPPSSDESPEYEDSVSAEKDAWDERTKKILKNLPRGVDEGAAKQILNDIVIHGDEVHWDDVAGLEIAKSALKETVVYPFLRPDLFMGLREPARGMLLFGPPGTGKTMLARCVATESKSVFFAISASSLTSKYLGESEKLVRALFTLAKVLAPSIIFVDEIDSLLGSRGGSSEHEATRRIKTEFLIQWSDLQKAAAGREEKDKVKGDASRVLVLAATNLPWAIDEAARRRFVRRQYIPLPEDWVREKQLRTLLSAQKHSLNDRDLKQLVRQTDGFSGSDITALAKDAAMGPLRSLGEKLLHMSPDDIRPIGLEDFVASLSNIRPSVSKTGLKEFEDWAREFGERGG